MLETMSFVFLCDGRDSKGRMMTHLPSIPFRMQCLLQGSVSKFAFVCLGCQLSCLVGPFLLLLCLWLEGTRTIRRSSFYDGKKAKLKHKFWRCLVFGTSSKEWKENHDIWAAWHCAALQRLPSLLTCVCQLGWIGSNVMYDLYSNRFLWSFGCLIVSAAKFMYE